MNTRARILVVAAVACLLAAGCGSSGGTAGSREAALGTPGNPVRGQEQDEGTEELTEHSPAYKRRQAQRAHAPGTAAAPCSLVSRARAQVILGAPIAAPTEAPLGPTCLYRTSDRTMLVTVAVPRMKFSAVRHRLRRRTPVAGLGHAFCAIDGRPMLYAPVGSGQVLSVAAPCPLAARFARTAIRELAG